MKYRFAAIAWLVAFAAWPLSADAQVATPSASASPSAAPSPDVILDVDPAVVATAKEWLHRFQTGDIDRSQLSTAIQNALTPAELRPIEEAVAPYGDPVDFTFVSTQDISSNDTAYVFQVTFAAGGAITESLTLNVNGKIDGINFKPEFAADNVLGSEVELTISNGIAQVVLSVDPHASIGAAGCPAHIDLSGGKIGHCTLIAQGEALPLVVTYVASAKSYNVDFDGLLYGRDAVEASAGDYLRNMYSLGTPRCDMKPVSVLKMGTKVLCHIVGRPTIPSLTVVLGSSDHPGEFLPLRGRKSNLPFIDDAAVAHEHGKPVVLTGTQLGAFVDRWVRLEQFQKESDRKLVGKTTCPNPADLSAKNAVICDVPFDGRPVRYSVSIGVSGFEVNVLDAVIEKTWMEQYVAGVLDGQLQQNGVAGGAKVTCGTHRLVIRPAPGYYFCRISIEGQMGYVRVVIENNDGRIHISGVSMDRDRLKMRPKSGRS